MSTRFEYVKKDELVRLVSAMFRGCEHRLVEGARAAEAVNALIYAAPAAEVEETIKAAWKPMKTPIGTTKHYCSHCKHTIEKADKSQLPNFCEECGARMWK